MNYKKFIHHKWIVAFIIFIFFSEISIVSCNLGDPYKILGVSRHATLQEIRRAYKQLAKEWYIVKNLLIIEFRALL